MERPADSPEVTIDLIEQCLLDEYKKPVQIAWDRGWVAGKRMAERQAEESIEEAETIGFSDGYEEGYMDALNQKRHRFIDHHEWDQELMFPSKPAPFRPLT